VKAETLEVTSTASLKNVTANLIEVTDIKLRNQLISVPHGSIDLVQFIFNLQQEVD
jgi:hypothetical protein